MLLQWTDGKVVSFLIDIEATPQNTVGMAMQNLDSTWTAFDCTRSNQHGTTSLPLSTETSRHEAKKAVQERFLGARMVT